jgi:hypothetical protein
MIAFGNGSKEKSSVFLIKNHPLMEKYRKEIVEWRKVL